MKKHEKSALRWCDRQGSTPKRRAPFSPADGPLTESFSVPSNRGYIRDLLIWIATSTAITALAVLAVYFASLA